MSDNIFVMTCGGLGDQVCAEPVVREIRRMFPDKRIGVLGQRAFFGHLGVEVFNYEETTQTSGDTLVLRTFAAEELGITFFVHPVDYISISTIRRQLPNKLKQMTLRAGKNKFGLRDHLLIHPGMTWANRTFPSSWWQEVVELISGERKCALIGSTFPDGTQEGKGIVDVECPPGCVDLRDQTSIEDLISLISMNDVLSNDSFPVHVAGAFDNWIFMIPTVKHPDLVLPFRNGRQDHKTCCPLRRLMSEEIAFPVQGSFRIDEIPSGLDIMDCLPTPRQVLESVTHEWRLPLDGSILWCR